MFGLWLTYVLWTVIGSGIAYRPQAGLHLTNGLDFLNYWAGPRIAARDIQALFVTDAYQAALHRLYDGQFAVLNWSYPLHLLFYCAPFSALPYLPALLLWSVFGLTLYFTTLRAALPSPASRWVIAAALIAPATVVELLTRQNGFFTAAGALGTLVLMAQGRTMLAGVLLGCLSVKPQLFVLWPLMLIGIGAWRVFFTATLTVAALLAASLLVHGLAAWETYLAVVPPLQWQQLSAEAFAAKRLLSHLMMPGVTAAMRLVVAPEIWVQGMQWLTSLGVAITALWVLRWPLTIGQRALLLASAGMLVSPYGFNYDLAFLSAALLLRWNERGHPSMVCLLIESFAFLLPLLVYLFNLAEIPLSPVILLLVFFITVREARAHPAPTARGPA
ncbi:MAG: glycosyltransferase family 87 protein [Rickettsiales bacterium]